MDSVKRLIETIGGKKNICPKEAAAQERRARSLIYSNGSTPAVLPESRVRMVFSRNCDKKTLLFDSQAGMDPKERVNEALLSWSMCDVRCDKLENSSGSSSSNGWKRLSLTRQPSTDSQLLGEMIFGSTPMKLHGDTLKVHYMKSTDQLMLTKVFSLRRRPPSSCNLSESESCPMSSVSVSPRDSCSPLPRMVNEAIHNYSTHPSSASRHQLHVAKSRSSSLNVPSSSSDQGLGPSSYNTSPTTPNNHSPSASLGSSAAVSISSSLNKRILRARSTSMENWNWSILSKKVPRRGVKYALAVIVCLSELDEQDIRRFQHFIFQHFSLIDAHLNELKESTEEVVTQRQEVFKAAMEQAYQKFLRNFLCLYSAQRIEHPVWLSLVSQETNRKAICRQFMEELGSAITELDTKETKFFLSSVLTEVLSHHLAWVHTVSDLDTPRQYKRSKSLSVLAESHPYNPLWAQLGDLYGAVATPLTISRTVVTGQSAAIVCRLLYILSYFIRCSEIQPGTEFRPEPVQSSSSSLSSLSRTAPTRPFGGARWDIGSDVDSGDVFEESRGSSLTLLSEHDRSSVPPVMSPANNNNNRDTPLVKPHPFGFKSSACGDLHNASRGSHDDSDTASPSEHSSVRSDHRRLSFELAASSSSSCKPSSSPLSAGSRTAPSTATATPTSTLTTTPTSHTPSQRYQQPEVAVVWGEGKRSCHHHHLELRGGGEDQCPCRCQHHDSPPIPPSEVSNNRHGYIGRRHASHDDYSRSKNCSGDPQQGAGQSSSLGNRTGSWGGAQDKKAPPLGGPQSPPPPPGPSLQSSSAHEYCYGYRGGGGGGGGGGGQQTFSNSVDSGYDPSGPPLSRCSTLSSHLSSYHAQDDSLLEDRAEEEGEERGVMVPGTGEEDLPVPSFILGRHPEDVDPCLSLMPSLAPAQKKHARPLQGAGLFGRFSDLGGGLSACVEGDSPRTAGVAMMTVPSEEGTSVGDPFVRRTLPSLEVGGVTTITTTTASPDEVCMSLPVGRRLRDSVGAGKHDFDSLPAYNRTSSCAGSSGAIHERIHMLHQRRQRNHLSETSSLNVDMEGSLPPMGGALHRSTSLLGHKLEQYDRSVEEGGVPRMNQFADFMPVELPSLQDFDLEEEGGVFDFGHSLLVGHSAHYLPDFVLHGTSQSYGTFKEELMGDLTNVIKHSIIDEPIEHGLAVVASTDTWTSLLMCVSKTGPATADTAVTVPSQYIQQLLKSVKGMWDMRMPSEFCLSHLEDGLLALNERGKLLADTLTERGSLDLGEEELSRAQEALSIQSTDLPLLLSLAAVHCQDSSMASTIRNKSLQVVLGRKIPR